MGGENYSWRKEKKLLLISGIIDNQRNKREIYHKERIRKEED
jgi:hypothetical protein